MKCTRKKLKALGYTLLLTTAFTEQALAIPAFPGAEGPGAETVGGRGGRVIEVTNLNSSGPGSLREAAEASGPRIVVFKVAGVIDLDLDRIQITDPYITIAGQTAPEGGITIKGESLGVLTHDVVIRFIKIRTGGDIPHDVEDLDSMAMSGGSVYNAIVDHVSMSWANDEIAQIWSSSVDTAPHDITYSWNIIAEGIAGHSTGFIAGSYDNTKDFKDVALHHNLFANTSHRLPLIKIASAKMINNLVYNWRHYATGIKGGAHMDIIANKYKPGPVTSSSKYQEVTVEESSTGALGYGDPTYPRSGAPGYASIYVKGNLGPNQSDKNADNWAMVFSRSTITGDRLPLSRSTFERTAPLSKYKYAINIDSVANAETEILNDSGASRRINEDGKWVAARGAVDNRIINEYQNGTGFIPTHEDDVGGYPNVPSTTGYSDSDHDGMADAWEDMNGFDKNNASDNVQDQDADGYTNLEEFINGTNPNSSGDKATTATTATTEKATTTETPTGTVVIQSRISSSADDAEESTSGKMYLNSSDLELIEDKSTQTVGMRFSGVEIPANATISKAYIQFTTDESSTGNTQLTIHGEDTGNASRFNSSNYDISGRAKTNASASWSPADWSSVGAAGINQRSSDLTDIVEEVISKTDWNSGNAMAFILTGSGKRVSEAYDGQPSGAPQLYIEYSTNDTVNNRNIPDSTDRVVNTSVTDTSAPVITLTGDHTVVLAIDDTFIDPGATAMDDTDKDLTSSIQSSSDVDNAVTGTYNVSYTVTDSSGNVAEATRTVVVKNEKSKLYILQSRVSTSTDDAEESASGSMYLNSSDLELSFDHNQQTVGLRFTNLNIPENAIITKAYIQFKTDETDSLKDTELNIVGESTNDALGFDDTQYNISERAKTNASVSWTPAEWNTIDATGTDQSTSDLTAIVQEIVSETGWYNGNAMAFIITGKGKRVAEAYDGDQSGAPLLYVEYTY